MTLNIRRQDKPQLSRLSILLYGQPKIGKTTLCAGLPAPLFLACEPGGCDYLSGVDVADVSSLAELTAAAQQLSKNAGQHKTVVIDGITWLANQAAAQVAKQQKDARQAYRQVTEAISLAVSSMLAAGLSVVATGHSRSITLDDGKIETRLDVNEALSDDLVGLFSLVLYAHIGKDGQPAMLTKPVDTDKRRVVAGDRSGKLPKLMPLTAQALLTGLGAAGSPAQQPAQERQVATNGQTAAATRQPAAVGMNDGEAAALWQHEAQSA